MNTWLIVINSALTPYMVQSASSSSSAIALVRPFLDENETIHAIVNLGAAHDLLTIGVNLTTLAPAAFQNHHSPTHRSTRLN